VARHTPPKDPEVAVERFLGLYIVPREVEQCRQPTVSIRLARVELCPMRQWSPFQQTPLPDALGQGLSAERGSLQLASIGSAKSGVCAVPHIVLNFGRRRHGLPEDPY
jgi:hypothetical protein